MTLQFACEPFVDPDEVFADPAACDLTEADHGQVMDVAVDMASDILSLVSGGRVNGVCVKTIRPVSAGSCRPIGMVLSSSEVGMARYGGLDVIPLRGPRTEVLEVVIDGVALNPSEYGLLDNEFLFRREGSWPGSNSLAALPDTVGVFEVKFSFGWPPDFISKQAAIELAAELTKHLVGSASGLPAGVTSADIQGARVQLRDVAEAIRDGDGNLPRVTRFLSVYAPEGRTKSAVWSPELTHGWSLVESEGPAGS